MSDLLQVLFCNCCGSGCDCGCAETCRLLEHRPVARGGERTCKTGSGVGSVPEDPRNQSNRVTPCPDCARRGEHV